VKSFLEFRSYLYSFVSQFIFQLEFSFIDAIFYIPLIFYVMGIKECKWMLLSTLFNTTWLIVYIVQIASNVVFFFFFFFLVSQ
jgi:hypothetical protein